MTAQRGLALLFVTGVLVVMADFERTSNAAQALAVLIMTSVVLVYGADAIKNVQGIVGASGAEPKTTSAGGRYGNKPVPL